MPEVTTPNGPGVLVGRTDDGLLMVQHGLKAIKASAELQSVWKGGPCVCWEYEAEQVKAA